MGYKTAALILLPFLVSLGACTKKRDSKKASTEPQAVEEPGAPAVTFKKDGLVQFGSLLDYIETEFEDPAQAADVEGNPVSWSPLMSNEPALTDLQQRWIEVVVDYALKSAGSSSKNKPAVELFFAQPDEKFVTKISKDKKVSLSFSGYQPGAVIAKVGDKAIEDQEVLNDSLVNIRLYNNLFTQQMRRLDGIVKRRFLLVAAKEKNQGMEEYVRAEIIKKPIDVTPDMVKRFAANTGISEADLKPDMMKRLTEVVKQRERDKVIEKHIAKNLVKKPIKIGFREPKYEIKTPVAGEKVPSWGQSDSNQIYYLGSLSCQKCQSALETFFDAKGKLDKKAKGHFVFFFQGFDRGSRMLAEAGLCLKDEGDENFFKFAKAIYKAENPKLEATILDKAKEVSGNFDGFKQCFLKRDKKEMVDGHVEMVKAMGVFNGPLLIINGKVFEPPFAQSGLDRAIQRI